MKEPRSWSIARAFSADCVLVCGHCGGLSIARRLVDNGHGLKRAAKDVGACKHDGAVVLWGGRRRQRIDLDAASDKKLHATMLAFVPDLHDVMSKEKRRIPRTYSPE
jgi:hypothetical protein